MIGAHPPYYESLLRDYPHTTLERLRPGRGPARGADGQQRGRAPDHRRRPGHLPGAGAHHAAAWRTGEFAAAAGLDATFAGACRRGAAAACTCSAWSRRAASTRTPTISYGIVAQAKRDGFREIFVHAFLDGRDTDPQQRPRLPRRTCRRSWTGSAPAASPPCCGRYWAMDRDKRWDRVERAWDAIVEGDGDARAATRWRPSAATLRPPASPTSSSSRRVIVDAAGAPRGARCATATASSSGTSAPTAPAS